MQSHFEGKTYAAKLEEISSKDNRKSDEKRVGRDLVPSGWF